MSLDFYLVQRGAPKGDHSGIFVREDGCTKEISREEWDEKYPEREPVVCTMPERESDETVFDTNITHNLGAMADEAGIYTALWHPAELLDPEKAAQIREQSKLGNYHDAGGVYEIERSLPTVHARDVIEPLTAGLAQLKADPARFEKHNAPNGWGMYEHFVPFVEEVLRACKEYPDAEIRVSR